MKTLSIVTIVLNHVAGIERTASSVLRERPGWVEWTVIDGQSTDGTIKVLSELGPQVDRLISEPDGGIAEAFNKGIRNASGDYILFLNAGDELSQDFYGYLETKLLSRSAHLPPLFVGRINIGGRLVGKLVGFGAQRLRNRLPHQAMVIRRDLFKSLGLFRQDFSLGMDYEWSLRLKDIWSEIEFSDLVFSVMEPGGMSMARYKCTFRAYHRARLEHGMARVPSAIIAEFYILKVGVGNWIRSLVGLTRVK